MENSIYTNVFLGLIQVLSIITMVYLGKHRQPFQNTLDDSVASANFKKMVIEMQAEIKELNSRLDNNHLDVSMSIEPGKKPEIIDWKWKEIALENK